MTETISKNRCLLKKRRNIILLSVIMLFTFGIYSPVFADEPQGLCCWDVLITPTITENCCVEISVYNPGCGSENFYIELSQYNSSTSTYLVEDSKLTPIDSTSVFTLCPINGEDYVQYRIRFIKPEGTPHCISEWVIGTNIFFNTIDLSDCCVCPDHDEWLDVTIQKSDNCPEGGCMVSMRMIMPEDSADCYSVVFEDMDGFQMSPANPSNPWEFCLAKGASGTVKAHLFPYGNTGPFDTCTIEQYVYCDSLPDWDSTLAYPCVPDCFDDEFRLRNSLTCYIGNCSFTVWYSTRIACELFQDVQIHKIEPDVSCSGYSTQDIFEAAFECIVKENDMRFKPLLGDSLCYDTWRVTIAACWTKSQITPHDVLVPCDTTGCCVQRFEVCRNLYDEVSITALGEATSVWGCPDFDTYDPEPGVGDCFAICDWLDFSTEFPSNKIGILKSNEKFEDVLVGKDGTQTVFWVTSYETGSLNIVLSDVKGQIIKEFAESTSNTFSTFYFDLSSHPAGAYFYQVILNGRVLGNGKFLIE